MDSDSSPSIAVTIEAEAWQTIVTDIETFAATVAGTVLHDMPQATSERIEVSIVLTDDARIAELNTQYRQKLAATNVLSFPNFIEGETMPESGPILLGDIVLAHETLQREALAEGKAIEAHIAHLVLHGMLHLLGYDHEDERGAQRMEAMEQRLMAALNFPDPYADEHGKTLLEEAV